MSISEQESCIESDTNTYVSDDSNDDPTFDILEETQSRFSRLSIKKKSKPRIAKELGEDLEDCEYVAQMDLPKLDEKDQKSYEVVEKLIKADQVGKLKVDQCKVYLRKHGLRLTGNKDTLILRIKEYLDIIDGGGERKYPASSFVMNCRGDACTGDIVMFEQNVYEMFSVASRSATGLPCGTRTVAGRIVKESYGAAKQQHTFTIEVLWNKGEKPLPPLHPLLIKGRNLYRLKTVRQKWEDEGERQKILSEKHARGAVARSNRDARVQVREMRKMQKPNRASRTNDQYTEQENRRTRSHWPSNTLEKAIDNPQKQQEGTNDQLKPGYDPKQTSYGNNQSSAVPPKALQIRPVLTDTLDHLRQPLSNISKDSALIPSRQHNDNQCSNVYFPSQKDLNGERNNYNVMRSPQRGTVYPNNLQPIQRPSYHGNAVRSPQRGTMYPNHPKPIQRPSYHGNANYNTVGSPVRPTSYPNHLKPIQRPSYHGNTNFTTVSSPVRGQWHHGQKKPCRFYAQGRCYYGDICNYLHE